MRGSRFGCSEHGIQILGSSHKSYKQSQLWTSLTIDAARGITGPNITPTNISNKITRTFPEFETSCFIKLKNTTKVPIKPYFELSVSVANSGRSLKREYAGDVLWGVPSATADFAHVVVDRGNTTWLTPSPARGPRPGRPFLSHEKQI